MQMNTTYKESSYKPVCFVKLSCFIILLRNFIILIVSIVSMYSIKLKRLNNQHYNNPQTFL